MGEGQRGKRFLNKLRWMCEEAIEARKGKLCERLQVMQETEMSSDNRGRHENKERLLSGKSWQALQLKC